MLFVVGRFVVIVVVVGEEDGIEEAVQFEQHFEPQVEICNAFPAQSKQLVKGKLEKPEGIGPFKLFSSKLL